MATQEFEHNNPAGRIYQNFKAILGVNSNQYNLSNIAGALGVADNWEAMFTAIIDMRRDFEILEEIINDSKENNESKHKLWIGKLVDIKSSIYSFTCNNINGGCGFSISPSALVSLEFIAADLAKEEQIPRDELEQLRKLCDDLRNEIHKNTDLNKELKKWLLDLVRLMRDGIDRYKIRGSKGLRKQFHEMLGSIFDHDDYAAETKEKSPTIWLRIMDGVESMNKMGKFSETAGKALGYITKAIEHIKG